MTWDDAIKLALESGWENKSIVLSHPTWKHEPRMWCYHVMRKGSEAERDFRNLGWDA